MEENLQEEVQVGSDNYFRQKKQFGKLGKIMIFGCGVIVGVLVSFFFYFFTQKESQRVKKDKSEVVVSEESFAEKTFFLNEKPKEATKSVYNNSSSVLTNAEKKNDWDLIGVIRDSGLTDEEKVRFGLNGVNFQITDLSKGRTDDLYGYFIKPSSLYPIKESFLGKCVGLRGNLLKGESFEATTGRGLVEVDEALILSYNKCQPYQTNYYKDPQNKKTLRGKIFRTQRPAPDINYDYLIKLVGGFIDKNSASGVEELTEIVVVPSNNNTWQMIEENLGRDVWIFGWINWGYAESKFFLVEDLRLVN